MFVPEFFPIPLSFLKIIALKLRSGYSIWASVGAGVVKQRGYALQINNDSIWLSLANAVASRIYNPTEFIDAIYNHFQKSGSGHFPYPDELNSSKWLDFFGNYCEGEFSDRREYLQMNWGLYIREFKTEKRAQLRELREFNRSLSPQEQHRDSIVNAFRESTYDFDAVFKFLTLNAAGLKDKCDWALFTEAVVQYFPRRDLYRAFEIPPLVNEGLVGHFDHVAEQAYLEMSDFSKIQEQDLNDVQLSEDGDIHVHQLSSERLKELKTWNSDET